MSQTDASFSVSATEFCTDCCSSRRGTRLVHWGPGFNSTKKIEVGGKVYVYMRLHLQAWRESSS